MHGAGGIEVGVVGDERHDNAAALDLGDVIAKRLRDGVERQCATDEALHESQPTHLAALFCTHCSVALACHETSLAAIETRGERPLMMTSGNDYSNQAARPVIDE